MQWTLLSKMSCLTSCVLSSVVTILDSRLWYDIWKSIDSLYDFPYLATAEVLLRAHKDSQRPKQNSDLSLEIKTSGGNFRSTVPTWAKIFGRTTHQQGSRWVSSPVTSPSVVDWGERRCRFLWEPPALRMNVWRRSETRLSLAPLCTSGSHVLFLVRQLFLEACVWFWLCWSPFHMAGTVLCLFYMVHLVLAWIFFMLSGNIHCLWGLPPNELWVRQNRTGLFLLQRPAGQVPLPWRARQPLSPAVFSGARWMQCKNA